MNVSNQLPRILTPYGPNPGERCVCSSSGPCARHSGGFPNTNSDTWLEIMNLKAIYGNDYIQKRNYGYMR